MTALKVGFLVLGGAVGAAGLGALVAMVIWRQIYGSVIGA